ncbi:MAG: glycyl-radical enzyme activating protein [Chloroflexi bacterium]|nr:glycyl-radical enzyme activating protein [Anaerolineaceae bacterium]NMB87848.1 glycyl-radical enzyme activating protein [Chloroflexota bacterium]
MDSKIEINCGSSFIEETKQLRQVTGIVFDIQRYCIHDGSGLRTNVFLKGCPLACAWCSNPESQSREPELALFENSCVHCGQFDMPCPQAWERISSGETVDVRPDFIERADLCPGGSLRWIGRTMNAGSVIDEVLRDRPFYQDGGGLTLTGGEPTLQPHFARALLCLAKAGEIDTAMETSGYTAWKVLEDLLPFLDEILFDLKHVDEARHKAYTSRENHLILQNLKQLDQRRAPVRLRIPLIPGFNATPQDQERIAGYAAGEFSFRVVDLLPYHTLGKPKYRALQRPNLWEQHSRLSSEEVEAIQKIWQSFGFDVTLGG